MIKMTVALSIVAIMFSSIAQANTVILEVGLNTAEVNGVFVTRGKAQPLPVRTDVSRPRVSGMVFLDRDYRGSVFGKHRVVRDGKLILRHRLLPVRQRGDE
ncbi:MAG: hypothetical protein AAF221_03360 [Pseudomonadota bacterium]